MSQAGRLLAPGLVVLALVALLVVLATGATAGEPDPTPWSPATVDGPAVGAGFLRSGYLVVATGDAAAVGQGAGTPCSPQASSEDADLFLFTFPDGDGCLADAMVDTGQALGQEGVVAAAIAEARDRVVVGLPSVATGGGSSANVVAYDLDGETLTAKYRVQASGSVRELATDPAGTVTAVATQDGQRLRTATFRLSLFDENGVRSSSFVLRGLPRALDVSDNGRFVAVGGNFTQGNVSFGWTQLFDLSRRTSDNPVLEQEVRQARDGVVESIAVTDGGQAFVGSAGGRAFLFAVDEVPLDVQVGNGTAHVDATPDGALVVAAAGQRVARLVGFPEQLTAQWTHALNATATSVVAREPYVFVEAGGLAGLHHSGELLWERAGGAVVAVNETGRGVALASPVPAVGPGFKSTSSVEAAELLPGLNLTQLGSSPTISPGDIGVVNVTLSNDGSAVVNATLVAEAPPGVTLTAFPASVDLLPGRASTVSLTIDVSGQAFPGQAVVPLGVRSDPPTNATFNVTFQVGASTLVGIELQADTPMEQAVVQGQNATVGVVVRNTGNVDADVTLEVRQFPTAGSAWPVTLEPPGTLTVPRDSVTTAQVLLTVPHDAANGTRNHVIVRAVGDDGAAAVAVDLTVNPFEALSITPSRVTKTLGPGGSADYAFTVTNTGTVVSNVTLEAVAIDEDEQPYQPAGWTVLTDQVEAVLLPDESTTLAVTVNGPPGASDGDRLRVRVQARTLDGASASAIAFAVVDEDLAPPEPEDPKREPLGVLVPLVALLGAAWARRRGNHRNL